MSDPISLRNVPADALKLAHALRTQTGLSLNGVFRLALVSGLLIEATKVTPDRDGRLAGCEGPALAKALRRHLGSAIDLLIEYGEHPYEAALFSEDREHLRKAPGDRPGSPVMQEKSRLLESAIGDDLDALGIGFSLSEVL